MSNHHVNQRRKNEGNTGEEVKRVEKNLPGCFSFDDGVKDLTGRPKGILIGILMSFRRPEEERRAAAKGRRTWG